MKNEKRQWRGHINARTFFTLRFKNTRTETSFQSSNRYVIEQNIRTLLSCTFMKNARIFLDKLTWEEYRYFEERHEHFQFGTALFYVDSIEFSTQ